MIPVTTVLASPPSPPGSLTAPAAPAAVLRYLTQLDQWNTTLQQSLESLDQRAQASAIADSYTSDLTLAYSLWESIDRRSRDLMTAWDGGRVGPKELTFLAQLMWSRLPDPLGNPTAFSLSEATTLASALEARLAARLDADAIAGSGASARIGPLRDALQRCHDLAGTLGRRAGEADALQAQLDQALTTGNQASVADAVARLAAAADQLEGALIKETAIRTGVQRAAAAAAARQAELVETERQVRELSARCTEKIADAPRLGVPDVTQLGPVPGLPDGAGEPGTWVAARHVLADYQSRLDQVGRALAEAHRRLATPLDERNDLRGLLDAYRDRARKSGRAEDPDLCARYDQAHAVLWSAPCDLPTARALVGEYQQRVRAPADAGPGPSKEDA